MGRNFRLLAAALFSVVLVTDFQNCGGTPFKASSAHSQSSYVGGPEINSDRSGGGSGGAGGNANGGISGGGTGGNANGGIGTTTSISNFKPALAIRDFSCLACHAKVQSSLITDFGYPNSWYLGGQQNPTEFGSRHYMPITWQTLDGIAGQVIVPSSAQVPNSFVQAELQSGATIPAGPMSMADYLTLPSINNFAGNWLTGTPTNLSFANKIFPPNGLSPIAPKEFVYIGAPTANQIRSLVTAPGAAPWVKAVGSASAGLAGLTLANGVNGSGYFISSGPMRCSGADVVIDGTLLLYNAQIYAEKGGCRLYVTGSVFIQGPITYLNSGASADPTSNLQITSAKSIILGVGLNGSAGDQPLYTRLLGDIRNSMYLRIAPDTASYYTFANSIMAEANNISGTLLQDASVTGGQPTAASASGPQRVSINFNHVLLNAPLIHSRYLGATTGVIIAESAVFSLGEFAFNYDSIFDSVPVLPALLKTYDILCTSVSCRPVNPN